MPSITATAASDKGTRCSTPAFLRDAGMRHSRASRSTSPHVAPRASPDRTAVSAVNLITALTTGPAPGRLDRRQRRGNVRVRQRPPMRSGLRGLRQCRVDHFARRIHIDTSESLRRGEHAPDPTAQEHSGPGLVAVDRPEHREHGRPRPSRGRRDGRVRADADIVPLPLDVEPANRSLVSPARPAHGHDQVHRVARLTDQRRRQGSANTKMLLPVGGWRFSGVRSRGTRLFQLAPPVPTGTARYCLPSAA